MGSFAKIFALAAAGVLCACAGAPKQAPEAATSAASTTVPPYTLERFRDEHKLPDGTQRIVLDNPYGDIQLRQTSGAAVAIEGVEQRIGEQPRIARIEWHEEGAEAAVRVRYPGIDPDAPADRRRGRVDLYAFVPAGVPVSLRSDFGEIVVRRIDNPVQARSRSGRITVATHGLIEAESVDGELRIYPMSARATGTHRLRTAGGIVVDVHLQEPLQVEARAPRGVRADFPLDRLRQDEDGQWQASFQRGDPASPALRRFDIESSGGEVLLQSIGDGADR